MPYLLDWNLDTFPCESVRDILHLENLKATAREIFARKEGSGTTTQTPCRKTQSGAWNYCDSLTLAGTCLALLRALISRRILFTEALKHLSQMFGISSQSAVMCKGRPWTGVGNVSLVSPGAITVSQ